MSTFKPKLFTTLKGYTKEQFFSDATAGVIVAIIALPLSIALGISSGVTPERGLFTAIIAGFIISLLGGSRVIIGGPTGAFMVIVYGIVVQYGIDGLILATMMAGVMLILMGVLKLGSLIKFMPYPITTGFTSGIAVVIFSSQIKDFFGLSIEEVPTEFVEKWRVYFENFNTFHKESALIGIIALLIIIFWPKVNKKIPGSLIALIVTTLMVTFGHLDVPTIGSKFGELSSSFPAPHFPEISLERLQMLLKPAFTIAMLGAIESLLACVVSDGMIGGKHRSNMELVAQGVANIASGLFGGIPATGAIARTAANIKNGGRTPVAGMVHAVVLLLIVLIFMPLAQMIPLASLSAILIIVAYNMSEWREFAGLLGAPKSDVIVLLVTFFLTIVVDLVVAIEFGIVLAAFLFVKRMSDVAEVNHLLYEAGEENDLTAEELTEQTKHITIYEINGPFFFGIADKFINTLDEVQYSTHFLIIRMRNVPAMDATAYHGIKRLEKLCKAHKIKLLFSGVNEQPYKLMKQDGFVDRIGETSFFDSIHDAKAYAEKN
ncbi:SulP family inorganic anion transporter [Fusibacter sp. 3D3]|uniref:SulP family inorganic anion transporter n=1 Tax=Fusibacter sp. 3D3 TaxID=1048380 RepID=UPI00085316E6|nr:sulfate permease [Fusibacter sp. 3D3]GAU78111.1 sulfate permease [Fusibacter sp. 3D3]